MRTLSVPNAFFEEAAAMLRAGKTVKMRVCGQSMYPFLHSGKDLVELVPYPGGDLPLWTVVFYRWEGQYMIHRIVGTDEERYQMMGDGNIYRIEEVHKDEVIGVLRYIHRPDGTVQDCTDARWLSRGGKWYRWLPVRRYLIKIMKLLGV